MSSTTTLVMTIIGADRPGLVDMVAGIVAAHGGNWLESRMARLGGHFAGILRVAAPADQQAAMSEALQKLSDAGLKVVVHADSPAVVAPARLMRLDLVGHDRPGIVREISRALAANGVNVEELETGCESAPMSGEVLFKANATLGLPANCNLDELRASLERIAGDLIVDISIKEH
jgi:glycine cleavage system regulatory protein